MKKLNVTLNSALGGMLFSVVSASAVANSTNPFMATTLEQGYMVAENTLPDPQPEPNNHANELASTKLKTEKSQVNSNNINIKKTMKGQDGGCGAGSCAAKLNKAKGQNAAK